MLRRLLQALGGLPPTTEPPIVVLHDLDSAREAVARALGGADDETAPGLRRAAALLDGLRPADDDLVLDWARRVIGDAGIDPRADEVAAIRAVRAAVPGLMPLLPAAMLTRRVIEAAGPSVVQ